MSSSYHARFRRVLDHVDVHLDDDLSVESLADIANFSKYHFHRQFTQMFGMGVYRYVQLRRFKRASWQLAYRESMPVTDIALGSGYAGPRGLRPFIPQAHGTIAFRIPARAAMGSLERCLPTPERSEDPAHETDLFARPGPHPRLSRDARRHA